MRATVTVGSVRGITVLAAVLTFVMPGMTNAGSRGAPSICAGLADGRGLCNAYCERLDCPTKAPPSCARLRERFQQKTGSSTLLQSRSCG